MSDTVTPNINLTKPGSDTRNWARKMNDNLSVIDGLFGTYFAVNNLVGVWANSTAYTVGQKVVDATSGTIYECAVAHTSIVSPSTFSDDRVANDTYWTSYARPASTRGAWTTNTAYSLNEFVTGDNKYAICDVAHTSGATFDADILTGKWSVLVDGNTFDDAVVPTPGGAADVDKVVGTNSGGNGYILLDSVALMALMDVSGVGQSLLTAADAAAVRTLLSVPSTASVQPSDATLTALAAVTTASGKLIYATGVDTFATTDITTAGIALIGAASAAAQLVLLGGVKLSGGNTIIGDQAITGTLSVTGLSTLVSIAATSATIANITATTAVITTLTAPTANITAGNITTVTATNINGISSTITTMAATTANITTLNAVTGDFNSGAAVQAAQFRSHEAGGYGGQIKLTNEGVAAWYIRINPLGDLEFMDNGSVVRMILTQAGALSTTTGVLGTI